MKPLPDPPQERPRIDVSLTIVNVVLLLVLFFLVAGQSSNPFSGRLALPETERLPIEFLPEPVLVIRKDGTWELNAEPIAPDEIGAALAKMDADTVLHVLMDRTANGADLTRLMQRSDLAPYPINLVTLRKDNRQ